jgi:hypothetical protein
MRFAKPFAFLLAFGVLMAAVPTVDAQKKFRSGTISLNTKSVGFLFGFEWGSGEMRLNSGRVYNLRIRMLKAGVIGIEQISAHGTIYNLRRPSDIEGTFAAGGAGATLGAGAGIATMENAKGVIIEVRETSAGIAAKIAASGIDIKIR